VLAIILAVAVGVVVGGLLRYLLDKRGLTKARKRPDPEASAEAVRSPRAAYRRRVARGLLPVAVAVVVVVMALVSLADSNHSGSVGPPPSRQTVLPLLGSLVFGIQPQFPPHYCDRPAQLASRYVYHLVLPSQVTEGFDQTLTVTLPRSSAVRTGAMLSCPSVPRSPDAAVKRLRLALRSSGWHATPTPTLLVPAAIGFRRTASSFMTSAGSGLYRIPLSRSSGEELSGQGGPRVRMIPGLGSVVDVIAARGRVKAMSPSIRGRQLQPDGSLISQASLFDIDGFGVSAVGVQFPYHPHRSRLARAWDSTKNAAESGKTLVGFLGAVAGAFTTFGKIREWWRTRRGENTDTESSPDAEESE
jgi:hypothetical protein